MGISLIVTRSYGRDYSETGESITDTEWMSFVDSDPALACRTEPYTAITPDGTQVSVSSPPGQSELLLADGTCVPFLALSRGELTMGYSPGFDDPANPVRQKIADVARQFNAMIMTDAGDGFFEW